VQTEEIRVELIMAGNNDRKSFELSGLQDLASSIQENGLAQPITVRPLVLGSAHYEIVAGERRFRAVSEVLNWPTIPAIVREMSDEQASAIMLTENMARSDLNAIEEANAYDRRVKQFGWTPAECAKVAGVSEAVVKARIRLLELVPEAQKLVADGHLAIGHAGLLANLDVNRQRIALRIMGEGRGLTLAQLRVIVNELLEEQSQDSLFDLESFWVDQVQNADIHRSGKKAVTGAPERDDIPRAERNLPSTGATIEKFIAQLQEKGMDDEAAVVGVLYNDLVSVNLVSIPTTRYL